MVNINHQRQHKRFKYTDQGELMEVSSEWGRQRSSSNGVLCLSQHDRLHAASNALHGSHF